MSRNFQAMWRFSQGYLKQIYTYLGKTDHIFLPIISILLFVLLVFSPILSQPNLLLHRTNDLEEFFWPIFYFAKEQILKNGDFPLWNNLFLSGTPLLPDPQSPLFYLPNIIFLILPTDSAFIISFIGHIALGGVGIYIVSRKYFSFSKTTSLFCSFSYVAMPKLISHIEAGHFGLVASYAWLAFLLLAILKISQKPKIANSIFLAISLSGLFFTHLPTFLIALPVSLITFLISSSKNKLLFSRGVLFLILGFLIAFGLTAITLLPQLNWKDATTRLLLTQDTNLFPKWNSKTQFLKAILLPWKEAKTLDTEKWIYLGIPLLLLATFGFLSLKLKHKSIVSIIILLTLLVAANNVSPVSSLFSISLLTSYIRVTTRIWFILNILLLLLAGYGLERMSRPRGFPNLARLLAFLTIVEYLILAWFRITQPIPPRTNVAPKEVFEFLKNDQDRFRVFCLNRCIPQRIAAEYGFELVEGYSTLQQKNYFNYFIQLSQVYWDKYTLALPPFEIYHFREIQPHAPTLASYNVKYIISPHKLKDANFILEKTFDGYHIYRNSIVKPRAYFIGGGKDIEAPLISYSPNRIKIDIAEHTSNQIVLAEVASPGWKAFLDGKEETVVIETSDALRSVELKPGTLYVTFIYQPPGYKQGKIITFATVSILLLLGVFKAARNYLRSMSLILLIPLKTPKRKTT